MLSIQAFGEPGRFIIIDLFRIPETPLESIACGVYLSDSARIASEIPGISLSKIDFVTSGVMSRGAHPVPPVVSIKSTSL